MVRDLVVDPATSDHGRLRHDMRQRLNALRELEAALAAEQLEEVRALAFSISRPPATLETSAEIQRVIDSARAVAGSTNMIEARYLASRISAACAGCHPFRRAPGGWR